MTTDLSIVIVTYNSGGEIGECLDSLLRRPPRLAHETIVVDNASADGTSDLIRRQWPSVRVIDAGENVGFARASNIGIRHSAGRLVLLLNPDTIVPADGLDRLAAALDLRPDAAIAGPRLVDGDGRPELSCGAMIAPLAELRQKVLVMGSQRGVPLLRGYVDRLTRRPREVGWVSGACLLVRRADADAAGLLDERYFMYAEDVDFCAAMRARGRKVLYLPVTDVVHLRGRSAASAARATDDAYRRSQVAFYDKHHPHWAPLLRAYLRVRGKLPDATADPPRPTR